MNDVYITEEDKIKYNLSMGHSDLFYTIFPEKLEKIEHVINKKRKKLTKENAKNEKRLMYDIGILDAKKFVDFSGLKEVIQDSKYYYDETTKRYIQYKEEVEKYDEDIKELKLKLKLILKKMKKSLKKGYLLEEVDNLLQEKMVTSSNITMLNNKRNIVVPIMKDYKYQLKSILKENKRLNKVKKRVIQYNNTFKQTK